jgi:hypothetical protein
MPNSSTYSARDTVGTIEAAPQSAEEFVRMLLWDDFPGECCGQPVVGAEYMGQQEMLCCGNPEAARLTDAQIVAALRERFTFCAYCGGNDENPPDHCMDCTRPTGEAA